jgi:chromosome segregation ATPase
MDGDPYGLAGVIAGAVGGGGATALFGYLQARYKDRAEARKQEAEQRLKEAQQPIDQYELLVGRLQSRLELMEKHHEECSRLHGECQRQVGVLEGRISTLQKAVDNWMSNLLDAPAVSIQVQESAVKTVDETPISKKS